jgi:CubicO group peptidase (beta-lactamase class C family)
MKKIFVLLLTCIYQLASSQTPAFISDSLDSYIQKGMKDWDVPGLAIVIVKDGKVVKMKGYGVASINGQPVDENTLFMVASNTKLFTGTSLALLQERKKLSLDDRITKYFPDYRLYDSLTTQLVTIRDLLSHRIGTKTFQGDFTFWNTMFSSEQIMHKMRLLKPVGIFRQDYGYCNSCFLAAGEVVPKVTGIPWNVFVHDSILVPLDMTNSYSVSQGMAERKNVAKPYTTSFTGTLQQVPYDQWDNLGPAASVVSNVNDLSHWLMFQLDSGRYNGKQVMPYSVLQKTRDINIVTSSRRSAMLPINFRGYGLGLFVADYNGKQMYWHTGGAAGMVSNVCFVPAEKLGIAILTNNDNQNFFEALRYQVLDAYLNVPFVNRSLQQLPGFRSDMNDQLHEIAQWKARVKGNKPALPLDEYVGEYVHPLYGSTTITRNANQLKVRFNSHSNLTATLDYMDNDEWLLQYNNIEFGIFATKFGISSNSVKSVTIKVNDFVEFDPYVFYKK